MPPLDLLPSALAVGAFLSAAFGTIAQRYAVRGGAEKLNSSTLEDRLEQLGRTMRDAAKLLNQVQAEIEARSARAKNLKEEAQTAEELAKLNQAERDAIATLVRNEIGAETRKATRQSYIAGALFFIAGVIATVTVTLFIHPLH
jgi:VIT1/CCC1 family predicted Fe2+/Mn2+ transporter